MQFPHAAGFYQELGSAREFLFSQQEASWVLPVNIM